MNQLPIRVLFVCLGNICRSPAGEGILKEMVKHVSSQAFEIASCGIGDWHIGHSPDKRMREAAKKRGIALISHAQQFKSQFFNQFDYILAADLEVQKKLQEYAQTPEHQAKIMLMTAFSPLYPNESVPDPYLMPAHAFDLVMDILEDSCQGFLNHLNLKL